MRQLFEFPNTKKIASYSLISQTMNFDNLTETNLSELMDELQARKFTLENMRSARLIVHEAAHYFDNLATLSGQKILAKVYDALETSRTMDTSNKHVVNEFFNLMRNWRHDAFTPSLVKGIIDPDYNNWSFRVNTSFGTDINGDVDVSNPLIFLTFSWHGTFVGNIPVSIEALWEANAMWAEITYNVMTATLLQNHDVGDVELERLSREYRQYIYNSDLLVYSVGTHLVSSLLKTKELFYSFRLSKFLSSISLNLPFSLYGQLKRPRTILSSILDLCGDMNPPVVFCVLIQNLIESRIDINSLLFTKPDGLIDVDKILSINGLPAKQSLNRRISEEINKINTKFIDSPLYNTYQGHKRNGQILFNVHGVEGGVHIHSSFLIDITNKSKQFIFQNDLVDTDVSDQHYYFLNLFNQMNSVLKS
ncbi:hypothetical protein EBB07_03525 [Paenibacillaceae bacterium]|nr:hypothetical protein EBB07_03525 [Paenibacillaceae bacterium]